MLLISQSRHFEYFYLTTFNCSKFNFRWPWNESKMEELVGIFHKLFCYSPNVISEIMCFIQAIKSERV